MELSTMVKGDEQTLHFNPEPRICISVKNQRQKKKVVGFWECIKLILTRVLIWKKNSMQSWKLTV